jgi:hypothetical protein
MSFTFRGKRVVIFHRTNLFTRNERGGLAGPHTVVFHPDGKKPHLDFDPRATKEDLVRDTAEAMIHAGCLTAAPFLGDVD